MNESMNGLSLFYLGKYFFTSVILCTWIKFFVWAKIFLLGVRYNEYKIHSGKTRSFNPLKLNGTKPNVA